MAEAQVPAPTGMEFVFNSMPRFDRKKTSLSEWLRKLEQRFDLTHVQEDSKKIKLCSMFIGQTGEDLLSTLPDEATWEEAKDVLATRLAGGSTSGEAYTLLKNMSRDGRDLVDLAGEVEKLARQAYPHCDVSRERHAIEAFMGALDTKVAYDVQMLGHTRFADVLAAARRVEALRVKFPRTELDSFASTMASELKAIKVALEKERAAPSPATPAVHLTRTPQPPLPPQVPQPSSGLPSPAALPIVDATTPAAPTPYWPPYPYPYPYGQYHAPQRPPRPSSRPSLPPRPRPRCYLCDAEDHLIQQCPFKAEFRQMRTQRAAQGQPRALPAPSPTSDTAPAHQLKLN